MSYIDYSKLWDLLQKKGLNKKYLRDSGIHANTVAKLVKNENVTTDIITRICDILDCDIFDIMELKK